MTPRVRKTCRGMSLIGVMVALAVFATVAVAVMQVMARGEHTVSESRMKFIATGLAREGLELVQMTRDSNWFGTSSSDAWAQNICQNASDTGTRTFTIYLDHTYGAPVIDDSDPVNQSDLYLLNDGSYTFYSHDSSGEATPYKRIVAVDCANQAHVPADSEDAFIEVDSKVTWNNGASQVELKERLFNWYHP